jgi:hypothetical protein
MSKGTFFGNMLRFDTSLNPQKAAKAQQKAENEARDEQLNQANTAKEAEAAAKAAVASEAQAIDQRQKAKQYAAVNTPSRGFGSNSLENLSRSFLLRL